MKRQLFDRPTAGRPVIRSDNGPQFISHRFEEACESFGMIHERIPPKTPNKNAHIESFHSILEAGSIYDLSPYEYRDALQKNRVKPKSIKV